LLAASACVSPELRSAEHSGRVANASGAPTWVGQPLDWGKLEEIERWLELESERHEPYWVLHAELSLGEGRLAFARGEGGAGSPGSMAWKARLQSARAGFQRVLANGDANEVQRARAQRGLDEIETLRAKGNLTTTSDGILARSVWRAGRPISSRLTPAGGGYDRITIHHTAEVPGSRFDGSLTDSVRVLQNVQRNHVDNRGYGDIGYHFLVDAAGRVFHGRSLEYQGAHAGGSNNIQNIGVCLLGNFEFRRPSPRAMAALDSLLRDLRRQHRILRTRIYGHGELKSTKCPGSSLAHWTKDYRRTGPSLASMSSSAIESRPAEAALARSRSVARRPASVKAGGDGSAVR
jgi:N-acetylmuramoyl-L-alanine amidase